MSVFSPAHYAYYDAIDHAINIALEEHPRCRYAVSLLRSDRALSLADLQGKAKKFSRSYQHARDIAYECAEAAGLDHDYVGRHGKLDWLLVTCVDDFGHEIATNGLRMWRAPERKYGRWVPNFPA